MSIFWLSVFCLMTLGNLTNLSLTFFICKIEKNSFHAVLYVKWDNLYWAHCCAPGKCLVYWLPFSSPPQYTGLKVSYHQLSGLFLGKGMKKLSSLLGQITNSPCLKSLATGNIHMSAHPFIHPSSIHPSIHPLNQYLLNCYYVPGTMIGAGETLLNKAVTIPVCWEFTVSWGRQAVSK